MFKHKLLKSFIIVTWVLTVLIIENQPEEKPNRTESIGEPKYQLILN